MLGNHPLRVSHPFPSNQVPNKLIKSNCCTNFQNSLSLPPIPATFQNTIRFSFLSVTWKLLVLILVFLSCFPTLKPILLFLFIFSLLRSTPWLMLNPAPLHYPLLLFSLPPILYLYSPYPLFLSPTSVVRSNLQSLPIASTPPLPLPCQIQP